MFCMNCGEKLLAEAKFCPKCGNETGSVGTTPPPASSAPQISPPPVPTAPQLPPPPPRKKTGMIVAIVIVAVILVAAVPLGLFFVVRTTETNGVRTADAARENRENREYSQEYTEEAEESEIAETAPSPAPAPADSPAPTPMPVYRWITIEHIDEFGTDIFSVQIPDFFSFEATRSGFVIDGNGLQMVAGEFRRHDDYWEWLVYGIHTNQFGERVREDFPFDDGRQGFLLEEENSVLFYDDTLFFRVIHDGDMALFAENRTTILQMAWSLTRLFDVWEEPADLRGEIIGRWFVSDALSCQWFVGGEVVEFFANGTGVERFGVSEWTFTWALEWVWTVTDGPGDQEIEALMLIMNYDQFTLAYFPEIWESELLLFLHAGPPLVFLPH